MEGWETCLGSLFLEEASRRSATLVARPAERSGRADAMAARRTLAAALRALRGGGAAAEGAAPPPPRRALAAEAAPARAAPRLPPHNFAPPPYTGPSKEEVLALRKAHMSPGPSRGAAAERAVKLRI